jgi:L-ribulokinase
VAEARYTVGIDFGTESGRAVLVDVSDGRELATEVYRYANGVIDEHLPAPDSDVILGPDWALQDPNDYLEVFRRAVPAVVAKVGIRADQVIGIGIDFTACTMLPTTADGTPLCFLPQFRRQPHAWVKLWKHHAAQPEADDVNRVAVEMGQAWLARYGGKISSEWFFPKSLQILREAPEIYRAADRLIEAADWVVWQLTGTETRNNCTAGYKAIWSAEEGFPPREFFGALEPEFADVVDEKMSRSIARLGDAAGGLSAQAAAWTGLRAGTPVAVANVDAHVSVPAATVIEPGTLVAIMGTSTCHVVLAEGEPLVPGACGVVRDGVVPGLYGYEAGQSAVGDIFAWFIEEAVPPRYRERARARGVSVHDILEEDAAALRPGESGLLALDWWNGNRSVLVDVDLTGLLLGATLATTAEEIYRALIEATAYGTRIIIESFERSGVAVRELVAAGGLPERIKLLMQIYADVTGREIKVCGTSQAGALGSAMFGAVAAGSQVGGYDTIVEAARQMARLQREMYRPIPAHQRVYEALYAEYVQLYDYFGRGANDAMKRLKKVKAQTYGHT